VSPSNRGWASERLWTIPATTAPVRDAPVVWDDYAGLPPFRRCDAGEHGLSDADVRRLLTHGVLVRLAHGLLAGYRRPELATEKPADIALRVQAMQWRYPDAVAGWRTAAVLHGLWLLGPVGPVQLLRTRGYPRRKHDVRVDSVPLPSEHLAVVEGVVATGLTRTAVDLIEQLTGREALAIADSALRACFPVEDLLAMAAEVGHHEGGSVHRVLELADARSQSALESMSRWLFHVKRLPAPEPQVLIGDDAGPFALVDFLWREQGSSAKPTA
jgi:hypothetical protein